MIHRRTLLQMLGIGAAASALVSIPTPAVAKPTPMAALAAEFQDPLYVVAYTRGLQGERYHHHMPAKAHYEPGDKPHRENLVIDCIACFTGTVITLDVRRGENVLFTMSGNDLDTPHIVNGSSLWLTLTGSPS